MNKLTTSIAALAIVAAAAGTAAVGSANMTDRDEPAIQHCISDDFNDGSQDLCYTVRTTDGAVIVINRDDEVVSVDAD